MFALAGADVDARGVSNTASRSGSVTVANTKISTSPASDGQTTLVTLTFKAMAASSTPGIGLTDLDTADSEGTAVSVY